jgi:hypothetical protein
MFGASACLLLLDVARLIDGENLFLQYVTHAALNEQGMLE